MELTARTDGRLWSVVAFSSVRKRVKKSDVDTVRERERERSNFSGNDRNAFLFFRNGRNAF